MDLDLLVTELKQGRVIGIPTDTVYGLAVVPISRVAVQQLFELKNRPTGVPIAVLVTDLRQAEQVGHFSDLARERVGVHWPGPFTAVVEGKVPWCEYLWSADGSIGIRCPDHALARALAARVGPLAVTSANLHGDSTPADAPGVRDLFPGLSIHDGGRCDGVPSTVADLRGDFPVLLRPGPVTL